MLAEEEQQTQKLNGLTQNHKYTAKEGLALKEA